MTPSSGLRCVALLAALVETLGQAAHAGGPRYKEGVLAPFNGVNGAAPSGLVADAAGNLYGATAFGGADGAGTVYRLSPPAGGDRTWTHTVLAAFGGTKGIGPFGTLTLDAAGNLYGAAPQGGANGHGVIFQLQPPATGAAWRQKVIHAFSGTDGNYPKGGLVVDASGNLYGTTASGGALGYGEVFELSPPAAEGRGWRETILLSFDGAHGISPNGDLVRDEAGKLYGTTTSGGRFGDGTIFALRPVAGSQAWQAGTLFSFGGQNGAQPLGGVAFGPDGTLFGTTYIGGKYAAGTIFRLSPPAPGKTAWSIKVLHAFSGADGANPMGTLTLDLAGNIHGTTEAGGRGAAGTVFRLSAPAGGQANWTETVVVDFDGTDGANPPCGLIADSVGDLFGTTLGGGKFMEGTVFRVAP